MILLHVITSDENQALQIVDFLIEEKLMLDAVILDKVLVRKKSDDGVFTTTNQTMIIGRTKALLFNYIDQKIRERYPDNMPVLYSLAIVNMDWEQSNLLISKTAKV
jgi:hypothetical protein